MTKQYMYSVKKLQLMKFRIKIQPIVWILLSFALIFVPVSWVFSWITASLLHELFHIIALQVCGQNIRQIYIGASGAEIETDLEPGIKTAFCAMAGPLCGFLLLSAAQTFPKIAICGFLQSISNLIPVTPLDGSKILSGIVYMLFNREKASKISHYIETLFKLSVCIVVCYSVVRFKLGILPLILLYILFTKKFLANRRPWQYNKNNIN